MATDRRKKKLRLRSAGQLIGLLLLAALFALNALVALTSLSQRCLLYTSPSPRD